MNFKGKHIFSVLLIDFLLFLQGSRVWLHIDDEWQPAVTSENKDGQISFAIDNGKVKYQNL